MSHAKSTKITEIRAWLLRHGYSPSPRNPNTYTKEYAERHVVRYKIMANNLRKERQCTVPASAFAKEQKFWTGVRSLPILQVKFSSDDKIVIEAPFRH